MPRSDSTPDAEVRGSADAYRRAGAEDTGAYCELELHRGEDAEGGEVSNLIEVARRVASELTRESPSYNTEPEQRAAQRDRGYKGPFQYAPHLVALGEELMKALDEEGKG